MSEKVLIDEAAPVDSSAVAADCTWEVLSSEAQLRAIEAEYRHLWQSSPLPPPMLEFDWILTWWALQRRSGEFFVVVVRRGAQVVALAPLYVRERNLTPERWLRTVYFLGTGEDESDEIYATANGWIGEARWHAELTAAVVAALRAHARSWDRLELRHLASTALAEDLVGRLGVQAHASLTETPSFVAPASSHDDHAATLQTKDRQNARRYWRRAEAAGVEWVRAETLTEVEAMFAALIDLHDRNWAARGQAGACRSSMFRDFHTRVLPILHRQGRLWMQGLRLDGRWISLTYSVRAGNTLYAYLNGYEYDAARKLAPGVVGLLRLIDAAAAAGLHEVDFFPIDYGYKHRYCIASRPCATLEAFGSGAVAALWLRLRRAKRGLAAAVRPAPESPESLEEAA